MRTEEDSVTTGASISSNMNDFQNQSSNFDFSPKSDHDEKWNLENKCLFHRQFLEGEYCKIPNKCRNDVTCNFCTRAENGTQFNKSGNISCQKNGDWKYDEGWIERTLTDNLAREYANCDWKCKNLYSISDLDRSNYWNTTYLTGEHPVGDSTGHKPKRTFLHDFREYLVNYQESRGVPRTEYSFAALIKIMGQATGRSLLALLYVLINIAPVVEIFLYVLRFTLDKMISIKQKDDFRQIILQYVVLVIQLLSVYACFAFIFGFIVLPIVQMFYVITAIAKGIERCLDEAQALFDRQSCPWKNPACFTLPYSRDVTDSQHSLGVMTGPIGTRVVAYWGDIIIYGTHDFKDISTPD